LVKTEKAMLELPRSSKALFQEKCYPGKLDMARSQQPRGSATCVPE